jgi:hypothetical protein
MLCDTMARFVDGIASGEADVALVLLQKREKSSARRLHRRVTRVERAGAVLMLKGCFVRGQDRLTWNYSIRGNEQLSQRYDQRVADYNADQEEGLSYLMP